MGGEVAVRDGQTRASAAIRRDHGEDGDEDAGAGKMVALPEIDALVARLPGEVRETLDELFRARFVSVKKLPKKVFQTTPVKSPPEAS
jgi:hypothetical protein